MYGRTSTGNYSATWNETNNTVTFDYTYKNCFPDETETWYAVARSYGLWCFSVNNITQELTSRDDAMAECQNKSGVLSGISSAYEYILVSNILSELNIESVWVAGDRIKSCKNDNGYGICDDFMFVNDGIIDFVNYSLFPMQSETKTNQDCVYLSGPQESNEPLSRCGNMCLSQSKCNRPITGYICGRIFK